MARERGRTINCILIEVNRMFALLERLQKEWHVIKGAPFSFFIFCLVVVIVSCQTMEHYYTGKVKDANLRADQWKNEVDLWKDKAARIPQCPPPAPNGPKQHSRTSQEPRKEAESNPPPIQQDCGDGNCAASVGQQGGITAGQVNIGSVPRRISVSDMTELSRFLRDAKAKAHLHIVVLQNSDARSFAKDIYKVFADAGWPMDADGVEEVIGFASPGRRLANVSITIKGETTGPASAINLTPDGPLFYVAKVVDALKLSHVLQQNKDQEDNVILITFQGFSD